MNKKKSTPAFRHLGGEVPAELLADLDRVADRLGLLKKRVVAAAISAFLHAATDEQIRMYQEVHRHYYAQPESTSADELARDVGATLQSAEQAHKAKTAAKAPDQKTA